MCIKKNDGSSNALIVIGSIVKKQKIVNLVYSGLHSEKRRKIGRKVGKNPPNI